jgi:hypothetical protein
LYNNAHRLPAIPNLNKNITVSESIIIVLFHVFGLLKIIKQ